MMICISVRVRREAPKKTPRSRWLRATADWLVRRGRLRHLSMPISQSAISPIRAQLKRRDSVKSLGLRDISRSPTFRKTAIYCSNSSHSSSLLWLRRHNFWICTALYFGFRIHSPATLWWLFVLIYMYFLYCINFFDTNFRIFIW